MRTLLTVVLIAVAVPLISAAEQTDDAPPPAYDIDRLYQEVWRVVRNYYPEATFHQFDGKIHFEYDTRAFVIHGGLKTGEWQDPSEVRGPKQHGIIGDIQILQGPYRGAAEVPQSFDKRYFTTHLSAPYSEAIDAHLHILIKCPRQVPDGFLDDINEMLNNFGQYVTLKNAVEPTENGPPSAYNTDRLDQEVQRVVRNYYPEAAFQHQPDGKIHFEYEARDFIIHVANKGGEWQAPWEERGPKPHGIVGDIQIKPGPYRGSIAIVSFDGSGFGGYDKGYFTTRSISPYDEPLDATLYVQINCPREVPDAFLDDINELLNGFGQYVTAETAE